MIDLVIILIVFVLLFILYAYSIKDEKRIKKLEEEIDAIYDFVEGLDRDIQELYDANKYETVITLDKE